MEREAQNRNHELQLCFGMGFSNNHVYMNFLEVLLEDRFGFHIFKEQTSDAKTAVLWIILLSFKDQKSGVPFTR